MTGEKDVGKILFFRSLIPRLCVPNNYLILKLEIYFISFFLIPSLFSLFLPIFLLLYLALSLSIYTLYFFSLSYFTLYYYSLSLSLSTFSLFQSHSLSLSISLFISLSVNASTIVKTKPIKS